MVPVLYGIWPQAIIIRSTVAEVDSSLVPIQPVDFVREIEVTVEG